MGVREPSKGSSFLFHAPADSAWGLVEMLKEYEAER